VTIDWRATSHLLDELGREWEEGDLEFIDLVLAT
jgi:hypothetical protein